MQVLNLVTNEQARFFKQQVRELERRGVESTTIAVPKTHEPGEPRTVLDYIKIVPPTIRRSFDDYDLIHANNGLTAPAALAQPNLPVVTSLWGSDLLGEYGSITRRVAPRCDEVVVMSAEMAAELDCDPTVIPHGVDLERFQPSDREAARAELGWNPDARHVLFPYGEDRPVKNYPRAERIVERAAERVEDDVEIQTVTGVPHARMPTYYNAADLLLLTSKHEGSPNAVKEAMACNVPVVATPVGDVPERLAGVSPSTVSDDDAELADAVVEVLETGARSDGRDVAASELSVEATSGELADVYRRVAGKRPAPAD